MPRVDVWDIPEDKPSEPIWIGYKRTLTEKYELGRKLGEGGFGSVRVVVQKSSGAEFACKSICKRLDVPGLAPIKQQQHLENIKREVLILRKLRGTLNVVHLAGAYEDESHVHIIMEFCRGGELFHKMGHRHYSERTVASYMRAVLRTLAQCHAHRILHRDIKPGNFMLLTEAQDSPLKAIDFGLAVFFDPSKLPRTDLGLEGTPWYMAPEVLSSSVEPASDVWAAGVMAYQLLSGRFPFDDWAHPEAPALSLVWRSILSESPSFKGSSWKEISEQAKDFCRTLLNKDPASRPSARDALGHPWLQKGSTRQRTQGAQLTQVVQRLQRHSQQNVFKKTVLDMMANELLGRHMARAAAAAAAAADQTEAAAADSEQQQLPAPPASPAQASPPAAAAAAGGSSPTTVAAAATGSEAVDISSSKPDGSEQPVPPPAPAAAAAAGGSGTAAAGTARGVRPLLGLGSVGGGSGAVVTPQYAEGSVHRQQQLLRLVPPPKRTRSSLDLNKPLGGSSPGEAGAGGVLGFKTSPRASIEGLTAGGGGAASPGVGVGGGMGGRLEGTWHGPVFGAAGLGGITNSPGGGGARSSGSAGGAGGGAAAVAGLLGGLSAAAAAAAQQQQQCPTEGSVHRRGVGSLRGATSALEALRRARERAAANAANGGAPSDGGAFQQGLSTAGAAAGSGAGSAAGAGGGANLLLLPEGAGGAGAGGSSSAGGGVGEGSYRGPVKDPSTASLWDLQFMANRLAMEGSAHGNAYTARLLRAASTHAGKTPAATAMMQAAAALAAQQQQPQPPQQPPQQQPEQQQPSSATKQDSQQQQQQQQLQPAPATASPFHRLEGTWHGPSRTNSINVATIARADIYADRPDLLRDLSWHGRTSHMRVLSEQDALSGSKRASEHAEFLRFLEAAKRQRQEQRKVARLVLEGSTHGGVQYFLPARGTRSVAVPAGGAGGGGGAAAGGAGAGGSGAVGGVSPAAAAVAAGGSMDEDVGLGVGVEDDSDIEVDDENDDVDAEMREASRVSASAGSRSSLSTPGSSGRGGTAAAAALPPAAAGGAGDHSGSGKGRGLLGKLKHSFKSLVATPGAAATGGAGATPPPKGGSSGTTGGAGGRRGSSTGRRTPGSSRSGSYTDLNKLARQSWMAGAGAAGDDASPATAAVGVVGAGGAAVEPQGWTALPGSSAAGPTAAAAAGRGFSDSSSPWPLSPASTASAAGTGSKPGSQPSSATAAAAAAAGGGRVSDSSGQQQEKGGGGGKKAHLAEQILEMQSPGWQASLETRRRGQGAYAALMAATNIASSSSPAGGAEGAVVGGEEQGRGGRGGETTQQQTAGEQPAAAVGAGEQPVNGTAAVPPAAAAAAPSAAAEPKLRPKSTPKHVGFSEEEPAAKPNSLTPLEQALQVQTQQQTKQQQATKDAMLLQPHHHDQQQQQQQQQLPPSGQSLLPLPGQKQQQQPSWRPPPQASMLPMPSQQQAQPQQQSRHSLLPQPGSSGGASAAVPPKPSASLASKPQAAGGSYAPFWSKGPSAAAAAAPSASVSGGVSGASLLPRPGVGAASLLPTPGVSGGGGVAASSAVATPAAAKAAAAPAAPAASQQAQQQPSEVHQPVAPKARAAAAAATVAGVTATSNIKPAAAATVVDSISHLLPQLEQVQQLLDVLECSSQELITVEQLQQGLASLGYNLEPSEVLELAKNLGYGVEGSEEGVALSQFAASQLDWEAIQVNHCEEWLQCLRATFDAMDADKDGRLKPSEILTALRDKLPEAEVNAAIEDVLLEAAADEDEGLDFAAFQMLASVAGGDNSYTPLDQYDSRLAGSQDVGGSVYSAGEALQLLQPVPEQ